MRISAVHGRDIYKLVRRSAESGEAEGAGGHMALGPRRGRQAPGAAGGLATPHSIYGTRYGRNVAG